MNKTAKSVLRQGGILTKCNRNSNLRTKFISEVYNGTRIVHASLFAVLSIAMDFVGLIKIYNLKSILY